MRYIKKHDIFFKESNQISIEIIDDVRDMLVDLTDYDIEVDVEDEFISWRGQDFEWPMKVKKDCLYIRIYNQQYLSTEITNEVVNCILRALNYIKENGYKNIKTPFSGYSIDKFIELIENKFKLRDEDREIQRPRVILDFIATI